MTTTIVGRGPSLLSVTKEDFPAGRVIALNAAIIQVRRLGLPNPIFSMQRDGCIEQNWRTAPVANLCGHCPSGAMTAPQSPEVLIVARDISPYCFADYSPRMVIGDFGLPWYTMSAPIAVKVAQSWGETDLLMVGHDAYTSGSNFRVDPDDSMIEDVHSGYRNAGVHAAELAQAAGMTVTWRA